MRPSVFPSLLSGKSLRYPQAYAAFDSVFKGKLSTAAAKALLVLMARRGETADELLGCADALRKNEPQIKDRIPGLTDTCGTGGDNSQSFNISTLAAIVAAGAGCKIAKHGNRAFSSKCGSSDLMESFGIDLAAPAKKMTGAIRKTGLGYFHAPNYHPALAPLQAMRRGLKIKTLFNLLGPLANPMTLEAKLAGVPSRRNFDMFCEIFKKTEIKRVLLVHSEKDGLDEISSSSPTRAAWIENGKTRIFTIDPRKHGLKPAPRGRLRCSSVAEYRKLALDILLGKEKGPLADTVLINAGAAIWVGGQAKDLEEGIEKARQALYSGSAYNILRGLIKALS